MPSANEYVASKLGGYDWRGQQPVVSRLLGEYSAQQNKLANTATEPSIRWQSNAPGLQYNPGGGTSWSPLTADMMTNPAIAGMIQTGAGRASPAQALFGQFASKINPAAPGMAEAGIFGSGSQNALAPDILRKMWR